MDMSKSYKRPLVPAPVKAKASKDLQNEMAYPSWNVGSRPVAAAEVRANDLVRENSFQSRSSGSRPVAPAPAKSKPPKELHVTPVAMKGSLVTKRRSAPNVQPRKQPVVSGEKFAQEGDKSSKLVRKKIPKPSAHKVTSKPDSGDSDGKPRSSGSDEEREKIMYARKSLEQALEKADSLVNQLEKLEDDIEALEEEKVAILDELLVCEGLAVNPLLDRSWRPYDATVTRDDLTPMQMVERTRARRNSDIWHWFVDHQGKSLKRWSENIPKLNGVMAEGWELQCLSNSRSMKEDSEQPLIPDKIGRLLHFASQGDVEAVTRILDEGFSPLANARRYQYTKVCKILVANGGTAPGADGEVRLVNWRGTRVAAMTILQGLATNQQIEKEFTDELGLLQKLRHPNIVQFLGAVTKSTPLGYLEDILRRKGHIPAREAVQFALDIARGINYLHQHKPDPMVHRDLKPRNLLQDEAGHLKVADFGLSKLFTENATTGLWGYIRSDWGDSLLYV